MSTGNMVVMLGAMVFAAFGFLSLYIVCLAFEFRALAIEFRIRLNALKEIVLAIHEQNNKTKQ